MKGRHLMLDLETLGQRPSTTIVSVGAVLFDKNGIHSEREWFLDCHEQMAKGRSTDWGTIKWWMEQSTEARQKLISQRTTPLEKFLIEWHQFTGAESYKIWGNGSDFDVSIVTDLWKTTLKVEPPWKFWDARCFRTLNALSGCKDKVVRQGTHHSAIDDARFQAQCVVWYLNNFSTTPKPANINGPGIGFATI